MSLPWGGGEGICMLFEIYEKRPFQKCMGQGGGVTFFSTRLEIGQRTQNTH